MKIHQFTQEEALRSLQSGPSGLSSDVARRRLREFGANQVQLVRHRWVVWQFISEFTHFFAVILWIAAGLAFWAEWKDPGQGMGMLGGAIIGVIVINGLFSFWQVYHAERSLAALAKLLPQLAKVWREGVLLQVPATDLVPGDIISLEAGDLVPADCRLIEVFGVQVNNATVTGESLPQARDAHPSREDELLHSINIVLAGTNLVAGDARALVYATGLHTEFGKIAHLTQTSGDVSFPLQAEIAYLSRVVAVLATAFGVVFFLVGLTIPLSFSQNLLFAIGIIVANVPEGLLPTVTLALAMGAQRMVRRKVLIRHLPAVETLGSATVICTDKTGTLTENRMEVKTLFLGGQFHTDWDPARDSKLVEWHRRFFETARFCQNLKETASNGKARLLGDPTEIALVQMSTRLLPEPLAFPRVDEVPFDSDRMRFSTLHRTPQGLVLYTKGALETLLPLCSHVQIGAVAERLTAQQHDSYLQAQNRMAEEGLRVLATAHRTVPEGYARDKLEQGLTLTGLVGLDDPPRPEVPAAIRTCHAAGIRVIMITGDHPQTATAVARQIGLVDADSSVVIAGDELRRMSDTQLQLALDMPQLIFARIGADQKMRIVRILQRKGEIVAVTGDGVNDAPALKQADIGIAMGMTGTDVARESADVVLMDDNFASIIAGIEEGRAVFDNTRKFLTYVLTHNIPELVPYLAFVLFRIPLPLTIVQILAVDLGTDLLPALALGAELPHPQVMRRPPRSRGQRLLTWPLLARAYLFLGVIEAIAALAAFFFVLLPAGWRYGQPIPLTDPLYPAYIRATTACLVAIVLMQVVNVFVCRSDRASILSNGLWKNKLILMGVAVELLLILGIAYIPWGNTIFGTAPVSWRVWLFVLPFAAAMLLLDELRKWFRWHNTAHESAPRPTIHRTLANHGAPNDHRRECMPHDPWKR